MSVEALKEMDTVIQAQAPIIWIVSHEENTVLSYLSKNYKQEDNFVVETWSAAHGLIPVNQNEVGQVNDETKPPLQMLQKLKDACPDDKSREKRRLYLLKDINVLMNDLLCRSIKDQIQSLVLNRQSLIIISPMLGYGPNYQNSGIPPTLEKNIYVVWVTPPNQQAIYEYIEKQMSEAGLQDGDIDDVDAVCAACRGLTLSEIDMALTSSFIEKQQFNSSVVLDMKSKMVNKTGLIDVVNSDITMDHIGGLDAVKEYFDTRKGCFTRAAKEYGVRPPRGIILTGIPGAGKSIITKAIANQMKLPCWLLDIGKILKGIVGSSEAQMRTAIKQIEAAAPVLLWLEEIEKGFAGIHSEGRSDGGTFSRIFGTLLTAMQEGLEDVMVIATSNNVSGLPPELIRRFDKVFFVDIPNEAERLQILDIHLKKRKRSLDLFGSTEIAELVNMSKDYTGAEIEKAVEDALTRSFSSGKPDLDFVDMKDAIEDIIPLKSTASKQVSEMREWAQGRAKLASTVPAKKQLTAGTPPSESNTSGMLKQAKKRSKKLN